MAPVDNLADIVALAEAKTLSHSLNDSDVKALIDMLPDTLPETDEETHCDTLGDVKAHSLAAPFNDTLPDAESK